MPDTPAGAAALARTDARVVARYRSFSIVDAVGADERRLRAAGAERRDGMRTVTTAAGRLDPAADRPSLAGKRAPDRDEVLALVQFVGPPKDAWLERLRATGARIVAYQPRTRTWCTRGGERGGSARGAGRDCSGGARGDTRDRRRQGRGRPPASARYAVSTVAGAPGAGRASSGPPPPGRPSERRRRSARCAPSTAS